MGSKPLRKAGWELLDSVKELETDGDSGTGSLFPPPGGNEIRFQAVLRPSHKLWRSGGR